MIPCFVINLAQAVERRKEIDRQLQEQGIQAEFIEAVDGRRLSEEALHTRVNYAKMQEVGWKLSPGEIGCALSHIKVLQTMIERNIPYAVVLEDDMTLAKDFSEILSPESFNQLKQDIPSDESHMVQLSYVRRAYFFGSRVLQRTRYKQVKSYSATCSTMGYILTLGAARKLYEERYPVWAPSDDWSYNAKLGWIQLHAISPNIIWASAQASDSAIGSGRSANPHRKPSGIASFINRLFTEIIIKGLFTRALPKQQDGKVFLANAANSDRRAKY